MALCPGQAAFPTSPSAISYTMGASYPALEYIQPIYEYEANATKIKGSHTIRFGADLNFQHPQHIEDRNNTFTFNGAATTLNGGAGANPYNALGDFLLGDFYEGTNWLQVLQPYLTMRTWEFALYARDQWHVNPKLTVNYGVRWEYYPVPTRDAVMNQPNPVAPGGLGTTGNGLYFFNMQAGTVAVCGAGGIPSDCGINVSKKLFAPSVGIAWRPTREACDPRGILPVSLPGEYGNAVDAGVPGRGPARRGRRRTRMPMSVNCIPACRRFSRRPGTTAFTRFSPLRAT